jgi:hypothetical protein
MQLCPSGEITRYSVTEEFSNILWSPRFITMFRRPHLLSQINPVHTTPSYFSKIHFNVILPPTPASSSGLFPFWLCHQNSVCMPILPNACYVPWDGMSFTMLPVCNILVLLGWSTLCTLKLNILTIARICFRHCYYHHYRSVESATPSSYFRLFIIGFVAGRTRNRNSFSIFSHIWIDLRYFHVNPKGETP